MNTYIAIAIMALTTYLIRAIPLTLLKKPIKSRFLRSFLHYVPTACLAAMTFPAILFDTNHWLSGLVALVVCIALALKKDSLILVALAGSGAVFITEQLLQFL